MKLPNVQRISRGGKVYKYHRTTGARLPTHVPEDHPEFIAAWTAEEGRKRPVKPRHASGSIGAACAAFIASDRYSTYSENYQRSIRSHLDQIAQAYGSGRMTDLRSRHIQADLAKLKANPARNRRKAWRALCDHAVEKNWVSTDPSDGTRAPKAPKTKGHLPWSWDQIAQFRNHWPIEHPRRLAFEVVYWSAARRSDAVRLNEGMVGLDGVLTFEQTKTKEPAHVPWTSTLPAFADVESHAHLMACIDVQKPAFTFILTTFGSPRSAKAFGTWLTESAQLAGIKGRSAHGLRKSRLIQLAEDGAQALALQSWGGHESLEEVQDYIEDAERKKAILGTERKQNPVNKLIPVRKTS